MKKRSRRKKGLAILLTAAMAVGLMPGTGTLQAQAQESQVVKTTSTTKTIAGLGTGVIADPTDPGNDTEKAWAGSYVYYGNYNGSPVKYRVLDASTTKFGGTTMLLDCDSILYAQMFDEDYTANEAGKNLNDWSISDVKKSLNGDDFLNKEGVFTTAEKNAIAESKVATHELTTDSETGVNVIDWTKEKFVKYVALTGEQIFILDAEDVSNRAYGYSLTDKSYFSCKNRKKTGSAYDCWWLRSADHSYGSIAGSVDNTGQISGSEANSDWEGVSPAFNVNLQSVLFSSVISGTAGETSAEYKLTLLDSDMTIAPESGVTKSGNTVTIPYSIEGTNSGNATQVSVLVLDKEYTAGNTNGAKVLAYDKLNVDSFSTTGTGSFTLPDSLSGKKAGTDYHIYIVAEDVNEEKETDYASTPVEVHLWDVPTVKQMNFGTQGIIDPAVPNSASEAWKGSYVYYGNYNGSPVKYRVLDASTTDFSADGTTKTMFLDCDSILYYQKFDNDANANEAGKKANDWSISDVKSSLNGDGFLNKEGVFTTAEKNAIAASNVDSHVLTTNSTTGVNVASWIQSTIVNYVALTGEQIFLLDAEDVSNGAYGYSMTEEDESTENRKKTGSSGAYFWWLRSAFNDYDNRAGYVNGNGGISDNPVSHSFSGVSPALNLNLSFVLFSSANTSETSFAGKSSALTSDSTEIGTEANTDWKLTLKDTEKTVKLTEGRSVTKASDGTITVPYTYTDKENATEKEKVNQISVMITDKVYDAEKTANAQEAQILYYGALQAIKNAEGNDSTVAQTSTGTGTFALPSGLTGTLGTDYHIYLLAEHVNADNSTDYASEPKEVTAILDEVDTVTVPSIDTPIAEEPLKEEITVSSEGVAEKATLTWKKNDTVATGNAQWKTTYQAYVTLTATDGYSFMDATGNRPSVTLNGQPVDTENITLNADGTLTVYCGKYTTATRKTESATAPEVPTQFANYYTADNVLSSTELGKAAKVTLEGTIQPNSKEMEVEWSIVDANGASAEYDDTPEATNIFKWTVKESEYADYNKDTAVLEGTVTIQNKDYTPVTITGENVTVTYHGEDTLNVSQYFTIDKNAGTATYELSDTSTGAGTLEGATLTMTTLGTFVVKVSTPIKDVYNKGEHTLTITVNKATPYIKTAPTATAITYGKTLADATLTGGSVQYSSEDETAVDGSFAWKEDTTKPAVADSNTTAYKVVFTPTNKNYNTVETDITVTLNKAASAPGLPNNTMEVDYSKKKVSDITTLPEGWAWQDEDQDKALTVGTAIAATAVYTGADKGNYETESVEISITRAECTHATTEVKNAKNATCTDKGYSGDTYCKDCGAKLASGKEIEMTAHKWDAGKVTKEATETAEGVKTYTCSVCGETKTETIPKKTATTQEPPKKGDVVADDKASVTVEVTDVAKKEVEYKEPANKKAKTVSIPATVKIGGVTYKVTKIDDNAFKNNKTVTKVTVGSNIKTIGKNAFYKCTKLKTVKIGKNVTTIGSNAFKGCTSLTSVTLPSKATKIGANAFNGCKKLKTIKIASTKLSSKTVSKNAFKGITKATTIKVPKKKLSAYKKLFKQKGLSSKVKVKGY